MAIQKLYRKADWQPREFILKDANHILGGARTVFLKKIHLWLHASRVQRSSTTISTQRVLVKACKSMNKVELCSLLKRTVCRVLVIDGQKLISAGSGAFISSDGLVLTAQHVVASCGRLFPGSISIQQPGKKPVEYEPASPVGLAIDLGEPMYMRPLQVDLMILKPKALVSGYESLSLRSDIPPEGTDVMLGGFPDDVLLPFMFNEAFEVMNPDMTAIRNQVDAFFRHHIRQMLCVHTMIGSVCPMHMKINGREFHAATYTTSIGMTHGGSGGPIVDEEGRLIGVSIRKGLTSASVWGIQTTSGGVLDRLPTNTGYALSHRLLTELVPSSRH